MRDDERFCLVQRMRDAQRAYFKTRHADFLEQARQLEVAVDKMLEERRLGPGLFGEEEQPMPKEE